METNFTIPYGKKSRKQQLRSFSNTLIKIQKNINFKISSRGWCYQLENAGFIDKSQFNNVQRAINECRKTGFLPVDFTAQDTSRIFDCVNFSPSNVKAYLRNFVNNLNEYSDYYNPSFLEDKKYYVQILVEKIDLKTLFKTTTNFYRIPIATGKGWSDINQRARMIWRFKEAEEKGQIPVLLYCGDFDPAGIFISETLKKNIKDLKKATGWDCRNLIIDRFGLNGDFVIENNLSWIDNLITGSGKDLGNPNHRDYEKYQIEKWIKKWKKRKCEANALIVAPELAEELLNKTLLKYFSDKDFKEFEKLREDKKIQIDQIVESEEFSNSIKQLKRKLENES